MKIVRMTFDIAFKNAAPDVYDSAVMIRRAISNSPIVAGVEVLPDYCKRTHIVDAKEILDDQILDNHVLGEQVKKGAK